MNAIMEQNELTIFLEGKITSANYREFEAGIEEHLDKPHESLVLNFEKLDYLSSSGLRVILKIRKKEKVMKCVELSSLVYEVFEMTGFTELMAVEKAFEKISVEGCEQIGKGANGVVYKLNDEEIVKVYKNPGSLDEIYREKEMAKTAFVLGIPTALSFNVVRVGDLYGAKYEMLNADSLVKCLQKKSIDLDTCVKMSVDIMRTMHDTFVQEGRLPKIKDSYAKKVDKVSSLLSSKVFTKLRVMFEEIPEPLSIVHGDFHFKNILVQDKEAMLIDMDTLCTGYKLFEFVPIYTANVGHGEIDCRVVEDFMGLPYETTKEIWKKTLALYFHENLDQIEKKIRLIAYVRLLAREMRKQNREEYVSYYVQNIENLTEELDSLLLEK